MQARERRCLHVPRLQERVLDSLSSMGRRLCLSTLANPRQDCVVFLQLQLR